MTVGDRVAGVRVADNSVYGAIAEYVMLHEAEVALVPNTLTSTQAASIGMNALTAAQALAQFGEPGKRTMLVTGAAGGLGGLAIEQAVTASWTVTGLARASDQESVESRQARLVTGLDGTTYDAVFDAAPLQFDDQLLNAVVLPSVAFGGTFCSVRSADWTIDAYFLVGGITFAILAVRYRAQHADAQRRASSLLGRH